METMIGMIVTGHGSFATGITSGIQLLAGELEQYEAVDFLPEDSVDELTKKLNVALEHLAECAGIMIFADLVGGSPFNVSLRLKLEAGKTIEVIGGANLPVVLHTYMSRTRKPDLADLALEAVTTGKEQLVWYRQSDTDDEEYEE